MTEHLPECRLGEPCDIDIAEHGFCSMQVEEQFFCIHCMRECICERLRSCEQRVLDAARDSVAAIFPFEFWEGVEGRPAAWCVVKADVLFAIAGIKGERP
jgi:hypothetical protein